MTIHSQPPKVLLDTNVLFQARLRDLMVQFALLGLHEIGASATTFVELKIALQRSGRVSDLSVEKLVENLSGLLFLSPDDRLDSAPRANDQADQHLVFAAIHSKADYLVTHNLKDLPELIDTNETLSPGQYLMMMLDHHEALVLLSVHLVIRRYKNPPIDSDRFCASLERVGVERFASALRVRLGLGK